MELYLIEYNNMVIGAYDDFSMAELFVNSCIQSKLMINECKIIKYKKNSCFSTGVHQYNMQNQQVVQPVVQPTAQPVVQQVLPTIQPKIRNVDVPIMKPIDLENNEAYQKVAKEKSELLRNLNTMKLKKEKMIESKQVYTNDLNLFELFTKNKQSDPNFIIPELFVEKFTLFTKLKKDGILSWETFTKEYKTTGMNQYDEYFVSNDYENDVIAYDSTASNSINEELDIETDSDTDSSEK